MTMHTTIRAAGSLQDQLHIDDAAHNIVTIADLSADLICDLRRHFEDLIPGLAASGGDFERIRVLLRMIRTEASGLFTVE